jgi:hypothetical protein
MNSPFAPVFSANLTPVSLLVSVTLAPATGSELGSMAVPVIVPLTV